MLVENPRDPGIRLLNGGCGIGDLDRRFDDRSRTCLIQVEGAIQMTLARSRNHCSWKTRLAEVPARMMNCRLR